MLFSSIPFIYYFLPCVLVAYFIAPKSIKNAVLLLASLVFYAWGEPAYVFLMAGSVIVGYVFGLLIEKYHSKLCLTVAIILNLGVLFYFKYANFFIKNFNAATGLSIPGLRIVLPIGISFYTFQLISYLIDVYRQSAKAQRNPISLATYIFMFPQLIAGPIVRYTDVEEQLSNRSTSTEKTAYGIRRFVIGLSKKVLIANILGEFCSTFSLINEKSVIFYWAYAIAVSLQIYFDFSGYSDMAIGLGSILGFNFPENFNYPFISGSITEFWRRWHISLGSWFRDYLYFPLGGSRCGKIRNMLNLLCVWFLTGLWHGAEWTFIVWGLYFGILLILEKTFLYKKSKKLGIFGYLYTIPVIIFSFVIFDAATLSDGLNVIASMLGLRGLPIMSDITKYYLTSYAVIFIIAAIGATPALKLTIQKLKSKCPTFSKVSELAEPIIMVVLLLISTAYLVDGSFNPFLYFRF